MTPAMLVRLAELQRRRELAVLATRLPDGAQILLRPGTGDDPADWRRDDASDPVEPADGLAGCAAEAGRTGRSGPARIANADWFLHVQAPAPRLLVVGAVHIAQALAPLARLAGLAVTVIDPRTRFATPDRFPGTALVTEWPDRALAALELDRHSAVVALSHDPKLDDPALEAALRAPVFYVGALGSRRSQALRQERLREAGFDAAARGRIRGPVGLPIGAIGAAEIALSIVAEIVAVRRGAALGARADAAAGAAAGTTPG